MMDQHSCKSCKHYMAISETDLHRGSCGAPVPDWVNEWCDSIDSSLLYSRIVNGRILLVGEINEARKIHKMVLADYRKVSSIVEIRLKAIREEV